MCIDKLDEIKNIYNIYMYIYIYIYIYIYTLNTKYVLGPLKYGLLM